MALTSWRFARPSILPSRTGSLCAATALFVGLLSGCRDKSGPESGTSTASSNAVTTDAQAPAPKSESAADVTTALKKELDAWAADQGAGNVTGYLARYDETTFKGTKRLREGGEKTYDFAAWKADRTKMLKNKPKVVADAPVFETWHDGKLPKGTAKATFIQRFKSGDYADHGKKVLTFVQTTGGTFKIAHEEMLTSSSGWEDDAKNKVKELDASAWTSPITARLAHEATGAKARNADLPAPHHLMFTLSDAAGKKESFELLLEAESDRPVTLGFLAPKAQKGILFEEGFWWAGFGDHFRVVLDAERIVVKYRIEEEGSEETAGTDTLYEDFLRVTLPKGAKVVAK